jgi:hypothetical protein
VVRPDSATQVEIPIHLERGNRPVRPIEPRPQVQHDEKRQQPDVDAFQCASAAKRHTYVRAECTAPE